MGFPRQLHSLVAHFPCLLWLCKEQYWFSYLTFLHPQPKRRVWDSKAAGPQAGDGGLLARHHRKAGTKKCSLRPEERGGELQGEQELGGDGGFEQTFLCHEVSVPEDTCVWAACATACSAAVLIEMLNMRRQHGALLSWSGTTCI